MDKHVASQVRRAKRSKAKILDLSCLGLPKWSQDIFELCELETLKLNDNDLTEIPSELSCLESLTTLDVSNNKIEKLPALDFNKLQNLGSINLEGNPVAKGIPVATLRQLSMPDKVPGKSPSQVIRDVLLEASKGPSDSGATAIPKQSSDFSVGIATPAHNLTTTPKPSTPAPAEETKASTNFADYAKDLGGSDAEYSDDFHDSDNNAPKPPKKDAGGRGAVGRQEPMEDGGKGVQKFSPPVDSDSDDPKPPRQVAAGRRAAEKSEPTGLALAKGGQLLSSGRRTAGESGRPAIGSKDQTDSEAEVARLQAQVKELKAQLASSRSGDMPKASLANTLPSRLHAMDESDGADKLKQQLQEEQRKAKRLERENQKLQDRMRESSMSQGSSSAAHVELSEIQEGDVLSKSGGFSVIYRGTWHGTPVAIKKLFDPSNSRENLAELDNEVEKLGMLRHPNIMAVLAVHRKPPVYSIIMEVLTGGSLYQLLHSKHSFNIAPSSALPIPMHEMISINESIALALTFMHARNVAHRDVKPHNVLLSPHLEVKVCDFGLARMKSELMTGAMQFAGTPQYMAPEQLRMQKYTEKVDVFAFGTVLWECMSEDIPFANLEVPEIREIVFSGKMLPMPSSAPRAIQAVIKACWTIDYANRPPMADVLAQVRAFLS